MDTLEMIRLAQAGDKEMREQVIKENVGLVWSIVKRFLGRGQEADDLFQIGVIGLMKAIDKFSMDFDVKFSTYAVPMISGEIKRYLRDNNSLIKMSRSLKENGWKVKTAKERLSFELGREATMEEIAAATELTIEDIVMAIEANSEIESIYQTVYQGDGNELYLVDRLPEKKDETESLINQMTINQLMKHLEETEQKLIYLRYFCEKTQTETAQTLGISQVQVSRLEKRILVKMRKNVMT